MRLAQLDSKWNRKTMAMISAGGFFKGVRSFRLPLPHKLGNFFKYHGIFAPGVRLLRVLPFGLKSAVVAACFLVPIALLGAYFVRTLHGGMSQTQAERQSMGVTLLAADLSGALHAASLDASALALGSTEAGKKDWRKPIERAQAALDAAINRLPYAPSMVDAQRQLKTPLDALKAGEAVEPKRRLALLRQYQSALELMVATLTTESGLATDPDLGGNQLQQLAFDNFPALIDKLANTRASAAGALGMRAEAQWRNAALIDYGQTVDALRRAEDQVAAAAKSMGPRTATLRSETEWKVIRKFVATAGEFLQYVAPENASAGLLEQGEAAVAAAEKLRHRSIETLSGKLAEREVALRGEVQFMGWGVLLGLCVAIYMLLSVYRVMNGGLVMIREQVTRMAQGDLSARPQAWGRDEVAKALASLGMSLSRLADLFAAVRQGVSAISHASHSMTAGSEDLNRRTELAAQSTSEIIQRIAQFVDQLEDSGRRIDEAMSVVQSLRIDALRSHNQMQRLDERMKALKGKSRKIGDIVEVIDHIAFRTNILSLNAAVEAAKAGPAGRGFAVVAQEVRSLALRTAESARQVSGIISSSTEDIEQCSSMADMSAESLAETQRNVLRINQSMDEIVALTREGLNNSQAILLQIQQFDAMTGENHELVRQMAAATDHLTKQGDQLSEKVTTFKLV